MAEALLCAVAHQESFHQAVDRVHSLRNTQLKDKKCQSMGGKWAIQATLMDPKMPRYPVGFAAAFSESALAHAVVTDKEKRYLPLCKWKQGESVAYKRDPAFAETVAEIRQYSNKFCTDCRSLLIASQQIEVENCFGGTDLRVTMGKVTKRR